METSIQSPPTRHWLPFLTGIALFIVGPIVYAAMMQSDMLWTPWFMPILATIGVLLMVLSLWRKFGVVRGIGLLVFLVACAGEWFFFLYMIPTPQYAGAAQRNAMVPAFEATLADGSTFTNKDVAKGRSTVMLF